MKKNIRFIQFWLPLFFIQFCPGLSAQEFEGDLTLTSQEGVDTFNYVSITGTLTIEGEDIINLTPLLLLNTVGKDLVIQNNLALNNLDGLMNLNSIGEDLTILNNAVLNSLEGFQTLGSVGKNILIESNLALLDLNGLESLNYVDGYLKILKNAILKDLDGLQNINHVGGGIEVYNNDAITHLDGLQHINSFEGYLKIRSNRHLLDLHGLGNISSTIKSLEIYNNDLLKDLNGLHNISHVESFVKIYGNDGISGLKGLENLTSVGTYIKIYDNDFLSNLDSLFNLTAVGENMEIYNNKLLTGFCGLYPLISGGNLSGIYSVYGNKENPTQLQVIENGSCSGEIIVPQVSNFDNTVLELGAPVLAECGVWEVPVVVQKFENVDAISLKLFYNESELSLIEVILNPLISSAEVNKNTSGAFALGIYGDEISLPDDAALFTLKFSLRPAISGTPFDITWSNVPGECELARADGTILADVSFVNLSTSVVTDEQPKITCPDNIEAWNDPGLCGAIVEYEIPIGTDNCPGAETVQTGGIASGEEFPVGTTLNTFIVIDSEDNLTECSFTVTVIDQEAPVIACLENITVYTDNRTTCDQQVNWTEPEVNENCELATLTSDYAPGDIFPVGTTTVTYTATDTASPANIARCSFMITVIDNTLPEITNCPSSLSAIVTEGCSVEMPDFTSQTEASDNCGIVSISQDPVAGKWMDFSEESYEVSITVLDEAGNSVQCITEFTVLKATLSGIVEYKNIGNTYMENVTLSLMPGGYTSTTDSEGKYEFTDLCAGNYTLSVTNNDKAVGYINATDAGIVNRWSAQGGEIEYVNFLAGDVSNDLYLSSTDALQILNNFVHSTMFERMPWTYWSQGVSVMSNVNPFLNAEDHPENISIDISGSNAEDFDLYALCTGDFNGSFTPGLLKSAASPSVMLYSDSYLEIVPEQEFDLPIFAGSSMEVGAFSLILNVPIHLVKVQGVKMNDSKIPVIWSSKEGELRIGWNADQPILLDNNEPLLSIKLKSTEAFLPGKSFELSLTRDPLNELADGNFELIQGAALTAAKVGNGLVNEEDDTNKEFMLRSYPNPFYKTAVLSYNLPYDGKTSLKIYNQFGQLVNTLVEVHQKAGQYSIDNYGSELHSGVYIAKLMLVNESKELTKTIRLSVIK